jgi:hypothetical protein
MKVEVKSDSNILILPEDQDEIDFISKFFFKTGVAPRVVLKCGAAPKDIIGLSLESDE